MDRPRLIHVIPTLGGGGAEREVARVARVMKADGRFDVSVCCVMGRGGFADAVEEAGVPVTVLHESKTGSLTMIADLVRFLREANPAIAHSHLLRWGPVAAKMAGVPVAIMSEHGADRRRSTKTAAFERLNIRFADKVVAVSEATRKMCMDVWRLPGEKVVTIPNAVDAESMQQQVDIASKKAELGLPGGVPVVGTIGRLLPIKAQHYFIDAAAELLRQGREIVFLIVGDGPCKADLQQQIDNLGVGDNVRMLGFRDDVREIIPTMDVVCLSSISEGTPITILEAMACRKPSVVTAVGGCPEVVADGVTGLVVPPEDPGSLAKAIGRIISDEPLAERMGQAGYERLVSEYSVETNLERLADLYYTCLSARGISGLTRT